MGAGEDGRLGVKNVDCQLLLGIQIEMTNKQLADGTLMAHRVPCCQLQESPLLSCAICTMFLRVL